MEAAAKTLLVVSLILAAVILVQARRDRIGSRKALGELLPAGMGVLMAVPYAIHLSHFAKLLALGGAWLLLILMFWRRLRRSSSRR
jgi:hypothetical protein